jgi:hypothetical protein
LAGFAVLVPCRNEAPLNMRGVLVIHIDRARISGGGFQLVYDVAHPALGLLAV